ncbi:MAG: 4-hydroxy-3-methylbut-2-enyl diphosphate reductase, partial [Variovorax sp.]|nr:4-hydroxy-3-methylbut-2-enyl diphosphate reductase [Variovorax sp.]
HRTARTRSYLIAQGSELKPDWVRDAGAVGVTAGASAPETMVQDVVAALRRLADVELLTLPGREERVVFRLPAELGADAVAEVATP